jgi:hypothetical protein
MKSPFRQGKCDTEGSTSAQSRPIGLEFRSSVPFCTFIVFLSIFVDLLVYSIIIPGACPPHPRFHRSWLGDITRSLLHSKQDTTY